MSKKVPAGTASLAVSLLLVSIAFSHDVWLLPERFVLMRGDTLIVRQLVGSELEIESELELLRVMTPEFHLITPDSSVDLLAELPDFKTRPVVKPVLKRKLDFDGLALVTMKHDFIHTEFSSERFSEYLEHEELPIEEFQDRLADRPQQTERYARTLKSLVQVGDASEGDLHMKVVGHELEVLLLQNPYLLEPGDEIDVQVLFEGKPLVDHLVTALNGDEDRLVSMVKKRTNKRGIARFEMNHAGLWLIRLVYLMPSSDPDLDWDSYWTSYSFSMEP